jgi:hypothetical protein
VKTPSIWELDELRRELRQMLRVASSSIKRHLGPVFNFYRTWNEPRFTYGDEIRFPRHNENSDASIDLN